MATRSYGEYKRHEEALKRNAKRREWERKNTGKSYARIKREEMDRKFLAWVIGGNCCLSKTDPEQTLNC